MTRFPSPLTTATLLLLLLSVAAMAADTGPLSVDTEGGNNVVAPLAAVPIEPEPANSSVVASRSLAPCTNTAPGKVKVKGKKKTQNKTCDDWAEKGKCDSTVKNESFKVSFVCEQSCNACPAAPTGCTNTAPGKVKVKGKKKNCDYWAENGKCDSTVKNKTYKVSSVCEQSCENCPPTLVPCTDTTKKIKVEGQSGNKKCAGWKKKVKGVCDSFVKGKSDTVSSECAKSCATDTVTGRIKVQGQNGQKKCKDWVKKGQCTSPMKNGGAPLFTVCEKSCNHCGGPPTEAPTTTWAPSATFPPTETFPPSVTFPPSATFSPSISSPPTWAPSITQKPGRD